MDNHICKHTKVILHHLPNCSFCSNIAKYDIRTYMGAWAYVCSIHYKKYGIGLGLGKGQELILYAGVDTIKESV